MHDDPPRYCGVELERDCAGEKGFCIVTAIAEMVRESVAIKSFIFQCYMSGLGALWLMKMNR